MNDKILKKATAKITERRQHANDRARENLLRAYTAPEFKELYNAQRETEIELARRQAYGEDFSKEQAKLADISLKQEFCLRQLGLNSTDLYPNYECKDCNDTGYKLGHMCDCLKKEINKELLAYSGFTHRLASFDDNQYNPPVSELLQKWCNTKSNKINIVLSGYTGTGKTFLIECIANELIKKNKLVLFTTAFNMNNTLLNYHISFDPNRDQIIKPYLESQVLIIDDLGSEPMIKNVTCEYLYLILNERMLNNLPTIITTNLDMPSILEHYGERVFSRISNKKISLLINLENDDLRLKSE